MNEIINLLASHQSIRKYKNIPVQEETVKEIITAAQWSSSSSHFQAYTIINVKDPQKRAAIAEIAGGQQWVVDCPLFLVFCADLHRAQKYWKRKDDQIFSNNEMFLIATVDASLAGQQAYIAASSLGLGGVYVGGIRNDLDAMGKLLNLPYLVYPVFGMCLGYPDDNPGQKPRLPLEAIYKIDQYEEAGDDSRIADYDREIAEYYRQRTKGKSQDTWSERCGRLMMEKPRENLGRSIRDKGFNQR
ncbi:MAG: nitroreductase [Firmicutes bacterium]|nr:nitroreductase [Bacillota bacterium]